MSFYDSQLDAFVEAEKIGVVGEVEELQSVQLFRDFLKGEYPTKGKVSFTGEAGMAIEKGNSNVEIWVLVSSDRVEGITGRSLNRRKT